MALAAAIVFLVAAATVGPARADSSHGGPTRGRLPKPSAASPTVTGPVTGPGAVVLNSTRFDLSQVGYQQSEFFLSGTASSYQPVSPLDATGRWTVASASTSPYTTRIVVNRPTDPQRFNGTVIVEWLNVSFGADTAPDWVAAHTEMIRDGFAWIGVSAQAAGVNAARATNPGRYGPLSHPGDSYSYDMFSQAGQAVWDSAAQILGGLQARRVLADGESQSAFRLTTYIDAVQPLVNVFDGFLVHSRASGAARLSETPQTDVPAPAVVHIRSDLRVPVLTFETETDVLILTSPFTSGAGFLAARQDDSAQFRLWEVAGTAHVDTYQVGPGPADTGVGHAGIDAFNSMLNPPAAPSAPPFGCGAPINAGEQHYVLDTAVYALNRWATTGQAPPKAPPLDVNLGPSASFIVDINGNVEGGIRTPAVDVPVATLSGLGPTTGPLCFLFGTTMPFSATTLASLYPSHAEFVERWARNTRHDAQAGFIRPFDADELQAAALVSSVGR
jgi:hypothetical protein